VQEAVMAKRADMLLLARAASKRKFFEDPPVTRGRKRPCKRISRKRFLRALEGTGGLKTLLAERLGCAVATIDNILKRDGWEEIQEAYLVEIERVGDLAEKTLISSIQQTEDPQLAATSAKWYLSRRCKKRGYADESKVTYEGGEEPIRVAHVVAIDSLDLPLDVRRQILEGVERKELAEKNDPKRGGNKE
jgi:hypothetical protein